MIISRLLQYLLRRGSSGISREEIAPQHAGNPLTEYFFNNTGRLIHKWHHYFEIYHRHFAQFRGRSPVIVEIGVSHGGSLQMWHDYFGPGAQVVGVDVDPRCKQFEDENTTILIGDQADRGFLAEVRERVSHIDILIDDGGHSMLQQIATFEELYPHVQPHGIYLCEDVHTSFIARWGGGYRREGTFLEYSKALIDRLHAWYSEDPTRFNVDSLTKSTFALHFYDSVLVIEKRPIEQPEVSRRGTPSF
jgi:cephalosporin hydroxylase